LRTPKDECASPAIQRVWLSSAYQIASTTVTSLNPGELKSLWDGIAALPCAQKLSGDEQRLFNLMRAVAARDAEQTFQIGTALSSVKLLPPDPQNPLFALPPAAAADIALNRPTAAIDLMREHSGRITYSPSSALALEWMAAIATERTQQATGAQYT